LVAERDLAVRRESAVPWAPLELRAAEEALALSQVAEESAAPVDPSARVGPVVPQALWAAEEALAASQVAEESAAWANPSAALGVSRRAPACSVRQ
jgi:hypothetical protein